MATCPLCAHMCGGLCGELVLRSWVMLARARAEQSQCGQGGTSGNTDTGGDCELVSTSAMCFDIGIEVCGPNEALVISGLFYVSVQCPVRGSDLVTRTHLIHCRGVTQSTL